MRWTLLLLAALMPLAAQESNARLQAKIEGLESVRAIKRLQYAYGHYAEFGQWGDFADLFTDDAATNYVQGARGRDGVYKLFFEQVGQGKLGLAEGRIYPHILFQPVVHLAPDRRSAKGRWRIFAMLGGMGGSATWYSGVYENEYALDDGVWKISVLRSEPRVTAAYGAAAWRDSGVFVPPHYDDASVARPVLEGAAAGAAMRIADLGARAARLLDQAEVTNLHNAYGYAFESQQWDRVAEMFAEDGTLELGLRGVYAGRASIRRGLRQFDGQRTERVYLQTLVTVAGDGQTAKARGVEMIFSQDEFSEGVFENTFVKQGGDWKIQSVHFYPRMIVDAALGWAKSAKPAPGPSADFPPDRGPTVTYEIYPKFFVPPFHFENPVKEKAAAPGGVAVNAAERLAARAEAYDAVENLIGADAYARDRALYVGQLLQPVIELALDGRSAKVRARLLELGETPNAARPWSMRDYETEAVLRDGAWVLTGAR